MSGTKARPPTLMKILGALSILRSLSPTAPTEPRVSLIDRDLGCSKRALHARCVEKPST